MQNLNPYLKVFKTNSWITTSFQQLLKNINQKIVNCMTPLSVLRSNGRWNGGIEPLLLSTNETLENITQKDLELVMEASSNDIYDSDLSPHTASGLYYTKWWNITIPGENYYRILHWEKCFR
jgi:hypothetical protein